MALILIYCGIYMDANSGWGLGFVEPILAIMRHGGISAKERYLEAKFGLSSRDYMGRVRCWL